MKKVLVLFLLIIIINACQTIDKKDTVRIGTFNVKWLGDGEKDMVKRSENDYINIAQLIKDTEVEVYALQEIENAEALDKLLGYLPDYKYIIEKNSGNQNVAILYKDYIEVKSLGLLEDIAVEKNRTREGLLIEAKKGNFDWRMLVVHFKSTSRYDNTKEKKEESYELRTKQAMAVSDWYNNNLQSSEQDYIILGDFNDSPLREKQYTFSYNRKFQPIFLTSHLESCKSKKYQLIDHIVVSNSAKKRFLNSSAFVYDFYSALPKEEAELISDHCPVFVEFEIKSADND